MMIKAKTLTVSVIILAMCLGYFSTNEPDIDTRIKFIDLISSGFFNVMMAFGFSRSMASSLVPRIPSGDGQLGVFSEDLVIPGLEQSLYPGIVDPEPVSLRIFYPKENQTKLPVVIYLHGGGNVVGSAKDLTSDTFSRRLASAGPYLIVTVDYRLSPEYPFPASVDDTLAAVLWVHSNSHPLLQKHGDTSKIVLSGDSNGGYLAIAGTQCVIDRYPHIKIASQVAIYPSLHLLSPETESRKLYKNGYLLNQKKSDFFKKLTLPKDPEFERSPLYQPMLGTNFQKFPPTHVIVSGKDLLRDDGILYFNLLKQTGVNARIHVYDNAVHGFIHFDFLPEAHKAFEDLLAVLKEHLSSS